MFVLVARLKILGYNGIYIYIYIYLCSRVMVMGVMVMANVLDPNF